MLKSKSEKEQAKQQTQQGKEDALKVLEQLTTLVDVLDPEQETRAKFAQNESSLLRDLSGSTLVNDCYSKVIEGVCDDLLETADKKIDEIKTEASRAKHMARGGVNEMGKD